MGRYQIGNTLNGNGAMRIISRKALREFGERHPDAKRPLDDWYKFAAKQDWQTPADVKRSLGTASFIKDVVVFNIGGNTYRLSVNIRYDYHAIFIRKVMTHEEYDERDL